MQLIDALLLGADVLPSHAYVPSLTLYCNWGVRCGVLRSRRSYMGAEIIHGQKQDGNVSNGFGGQAPETFRIERSFLRLPNQAMVED